ncbi:MAG: hypothetical protein FJ121_13585 [Deltaproteobacteria bacterium]|nr:hypothetical protein [Deltaproteobacteria bacterium]
MTINQQKTNRCRWRQTPGMPLNKILIAAGKQVTDHFRLISGMVETTWKGRSLTIYTHYQNVYSIFIIILAIYVFCSAIRQGDFSDNLIYAS